MKKNYLLLISSLLFFTECKEKTKGHYSEHDIVRNTNSNILRNMLEIKGENVLLPNIKLDVYLSNDAVQELLENKESVIASLYLYGQIDDEDMLPEEVRKHMVPEGLKLGNYEIEIDKISNHIRFNFNSITIPRKLFEVLMDEDFSYNINVFSGRRAFKDNILNMEAFDEKLSKIISQKRTIKLFGNLIPNDLRSK
ncbi:hypothetical protein [Elizabethkingia ursingii]